MGSCNDKLPEFKADCSEDFGTRIDSLKVTTPENYAELHNISLKTVYNWINSGKLQSVSMFKKTLIVV